MSPARQEKPLVPFDGANMLIRKSHFWPHENPTQEGPNVCRQCWKCNWWLLAFVLSLTLPHIPILVAAFFLSQIMLPGFASLPPPTTTPPLVRILALLQSIPYFAFPVPSFGVVAFGFFFSLRQGMQVYYVVDC